MLRSLLFALLLVLPLSTGGAQRSTGAGDPITILAFGDSLTAGYGLEEGLGFAPQLEDALRREGHAASVIDAGVSGETSAQGRERLRWTLDRLDTPPDLVILELGGNDMLRALDPATTEANLAALIEGFEASGATVLLASIPGLRNYDPQYVEAFESIYSGLGTRYGVAVHPFVPEAVAREGMLLPDGVHPNFSGIKAIVQNMVPPVVEAAGL